MVYATNIGFHPMELHMGPSSNKHKVLAGDKNAIMITMILSTDQSYL